MGPMLKATFNKHRIGAVMARIKAGDSIEPESSAWTLVDCLTAAGVLLSTAMSTAASAAAHSHAKPAEGRAGAQKLLQDLQGAIEFVGAMTKARGNGTWDDYFEDSVTIGIGADTVTPITGFKQ